MLKPADMPTTRLAILIDCDNARSSAIGRTIAEAAKYGTITVRRGYGDWTTPEMAGWKNECQANAVQPIQQFRYTTGKNATDSALIIDAMDLLHSGRVEGFCIVSSDSDFTRLATRIREQGMFVMGVGKSQTPKPFVNACAVFVPEENLVQNRMQGTDVRRPQEGGETTRIVKKTGKSDGDLSTLPKWARIVKEAIDSLDEADGSDSDGWVFLTDVGSYIRKIRPDFDTRTYGRRNLSKLLNTRPDLFSAKNEGSSNIAIRMADSLSATRSGGAPGKP